MHSLYENFVLEYFKRHHPQLNPTSSWIKWNVEGGMDHLLPYMKTDITLTKGEKTLIIDTKYYSNIFKTNLYNNEKLHSNNLYQIFSYVKNKDVHNTGNVSGVLLYAKTNEKISPNCEFMMGKNKIGVRTLDLNKEFKYIVNQLEELLCFLQ
ncbi:MAG: hypothetical protein Q4Q07_08695 [Tissierellia bacterium]|nr:hypothetical protein [Tissierellia bacterium]